MNKELLIAFLLIFVGGSAISSHEKVGTDCDPIQDPNCEIGADGFDGVTAEQFKLGIGADYHRPLNSESFLLTVETEYQPSEVFGIVLGGALPVSSNDNNARLYHIQFGFNLHLIPYSPFDIYFGPKGGLTYVHPTAGPQALLANVNGHVGMSYYFGQILFAQVELGYDLLTYAEEGIIFKYDTPRVGFKFGISI